MTKNNTLWTSDSEIYDSTQKKVIIVYPDTLDNILRDLEDGIDKKRDVKHFIEISLTLLGVLLTANFKDFLGIPSGYWFAIFFLALLWTIGSFIWNTICFRLGKKYPSREDIIRELMNKNKIGIADNYSESEIEKEAVFLIRETGRPEVYEVKNGTKRHIPDGETLIKLGYSWDEIEEVTAEKASEYKTGEPLTSQK